jgi:L-arabinokinase
VQRLLFYVSGHGFGHATRIRALIDTLCQRGTPALEIHVRTEAPHWIFTERSQRAAGTIACSTAKVDEGVLQRGGLDLDLAGTLAAHESFVREWDRTLEREIAWIRDFRPSLVVGDLPPLAFAAAARTGVPSVGIANFSWDWILEAYTEREPRFRPIVTRYAEAYATVETLFRLPLAGAFDAFPNVVEAPLLVSHSTRTRDDCRAALGIPLADSRKLVLVSFGGFSGGSNTPHRDEDLSDYRFVGLGSEPDLPHSSRTEWLALPKPSPIPHEDLMRACDAILGKPGYGTVAEAIVHDTRFLFPPRIGFREVPVLESGLARYGCSLRMPREDFEAGRWLPHLTALFKLPRPTETLAPTGNTFIADALREQLGLQ